ncbi:DUF1702 family protein [Amycolatopsis vastitatis]|uniref:Enediyne biosynthesis protein n=1 Tax=Amycolatopsis vastitatis TaxID=1905142 RepID=A0A229T575_9PSEU|nr:DUF1702 family protein [Amycolatopsis vastitatis]OXM66081.1 enediyne biosynthesis protein [Amycolatopsis vastitatis]
MTAPWRSLRRRVLTPDVAETRISRRGFHVKDDAATRLLEAIGESFLHGFAVAAEARGAEDVPDPLDQVAVRMRGFCYEGAAMAFAIRDGLSARGRNTPRFVAGPGEPHLYMAYVGIGWALARLPRFRHARVLAAASDPVLRWLVLDGYGFHQAYFHTARYVHRQVRDAAVPRVSSTGAAYSGRAIDQGIGRALWFVGGTDPARVVELIGGFDGDRRADLYSGAGLAATYAGGADPGELAELAERAGEYRPQLAQGSAFAAEARARAGLLVPETESASRVLCGMSAADAAELARDTKPGPSADCAVPAYAQWRTRVAEEFASLGG